MPTRPNCTVENRSSVLKSRTSQEITLSLTSFKRANNESDLCVKIQGNVTCKPAFGQPITFDALNSSKQYNFSVFSYTYTSDDIQLLSDASCPLSQYTCKYLFHLNSSRNKLPFLILITFSFMNLSLYILQLLREVVKEYVKKVSGSGGNWCYDIHENSNIWCLKFLSFKCNMNKHNEMVNIDWLDGRNEILSIDLLSSIVKINVILKKCRKVSVDSKGYCERLRKMFSWLLPMNDLYYLADLLCCLPLNGFVPSDP